MSYNPGPTLLEMVDCGFKIATTVQKNDEQDTIILSIVVFKRDAQPDDEGICVSLAVRRSTYDADYPGASHVFLAHFTELLNASVEAAAIHL